MFDTPMQTSLFGSTAPVPDPGFGSLRRFRLDAETWVDHAARWLTGDETLYGVLAAGVAWRQPVVQMYDRQVRTPRLVGDAPPDLDPVIGHLVRLLSNRYEVLLDQVSVGWYRDGRDSVAWHGDRIARDRPTATVATVSLGHPRRFLLRPREGGPSHAWSLGHGDLVVMGGACQRTWEHSVPKTAHAAGPRMALMFRHTYD